MDNKLELNTLISDLKSQKYSTYKSAIDRLTLRGIDCIPSLIDALSSGDWNGQHLLRAQEVFKKIGFPAAPLLLDEINNPYEQVRNTAIAAIGEIGVKVAVEPLLALLNHESSSTRSKAIYALGCIGDERAIKPVIESIDDNADVRASAAAFLRKIDQDKYIDLIVSTLEKNLSHPDWKIRNGALFQLGQTKDKKAVEPILDAWKNDNDSVVREEAFLALRKILSDSEIRNL